MRNRHGANKMHFFKLFLAATFAVAAAIKASLSVLGMYAASLLQFVPHIPETVGSVVGGFASAIAGALIARHLQYRNVPKAHHD